MKRQAELKKEREAYERQVAQNKFLRDEKKKKEQERLDGIQTENPKFGLTGDRRPLRPEFVRTCPHALNSDVHCSWESTISSHKGDRMEVEKATEYCQASLIPQLAVELQQRFWYTALLYPMPSRSTHLLANVIHRTHALTGTYIHTCVRYLRTLAGVYIYACRHAFSIALYLRDTLAYSLLSAIHRPQSLTQTCMKRHVFTRMIQELPSHFLIFFIEHHTMYLTHQQ